MGLTEKDADGYRCMRMARLSRSCSSTAAWAPDIAPVADLTAQYLKDIGILVTVKQIENALWGEKCRQRDPGYGDVEPRYRLGQ
jgi:hypothetical protein